MRSAPASMADLRRNCSVCEANAVKLDIGGNEAIPAPVDALWIALNDPKVLTRCVPGCKSMTEIGPDAYKVDMQLKGAAVGGSFEGELSVSDKDAPRTGTIKVCGAA